jgi:hypothetical protein
MDKIKLFIITVLIFIILRELYISFYLGSVKNDLNLENFTSYTSFFNIPNGISGLKLWLDAKDPNNNGLGLNDGTILSTWTDKSSNNNNAIVIGSPTLSNNSISINTFSYFRTPYVFSGEETCYIVATITSNTENTFLTSESSPGTKLTGGRQYSTSNNLNVTTTTGISYNSSSTINLNNTYIFGVTISNSNAIINGYINGNSSGSYNSTGFPITTGGTGSIIGSGQLINIHEIICYSNILSTTDRQILEGYLSLKWKIPLNTMHPYLLVSPVPLMISLISPLGTMNGIPILGSATSGNSIVYYIQDGSSVKMVDSNGYSKFYIGSPNDLLTNYYSASSSKVAYTYYKPSPSNIIVTINPIGFSLSWTGGSGAVSYTYKLITGSNSQIVLPDSYTIVPPNMIATTSSPNTATFTSNIRNGTLYTVIVTPILSGNTPSSNLITPSISNLNTANLNTSVNFTTAPLPVTNLSSSAITKTGFTVSWIPSTGSTGYIYMLNNIVATPTSTTSNSATFTGLIVNTSYSVNVIPIVPVSPPNIDNQYLLQNSSVTVITSPFDIVLSSTPKSNNSFTITWNIPQSTVPITYKYEQLISPTNNVNITSGISIVTTTTQISATFTSINNTSITPGTTYNIRITPTNNNGMGFGTSQSIIVYTLSNPVSNSNIHTETLSSTSAAVSWDNISGTTSYSYTLGLPVTNLLTPSSSLPSIPVSGNSTNITNLIPGNTYRFTLTPLVNNLSNTSGYVDFVTLPRSMSALPVATINPSDVVITWPTCSGALGYNYNISPLSPVAQPPMPLSLPTLTLTGLVPGINYTITIIPVNLNPLSVVQTAISNPLLDTIVVTTPPAPISRISIPPGFITSTGFNIQWPQEISASSFICKNSVTNAIIPNKTTGSNTPDTTPVVSLLIGNPTTAIFSGFNPGTSYSIIIIPLKGTLQGTPTPVQTILTLPPRVILTSNLDQTNSSSVFNVDWTPNPSLSATGYIYTISPAPTSMPETGTVTTTTVNFTNMTPSTLYTVTIIPFNASGNGIPSSTTVSTAPKAIIPYVISFDQSIASISFITGSKVLSTVYKYCYSPGNSPLPPPSSDYHSQIPSTVDLIQLKTGTTYTLYVYPIYNTVMGPLSTCSFTTLGQTVNSIITNAFTNTGFTASWSTSPNTTYNYYTIQNGIQSTTVSTQTPSSNAITSITLFGLLPGKNYSLYVAPVNYLGVVGQWTNIQNQITLANPITGVPTTTTTQSSITISWVNTSGAQNYIYTMNPRPRYSTLLPPTLILANIADSSGNISVTFGGLNSGQLYTIILTPQNSVNMPSIPTTITATTLVPSASGFTNVIEHASTPLSAPVLTLVDKSTTSSGFIIKFPQNTSATTYQYTISPFPNNVAGLPLGLSANQIILTIPATQNNKANSTQLLPDATGNFYLIFGGLSSSTIYTVTVWAIDNTSNNGNTSTQIIITPPSAITNVIVSNITSSGFNVKWDPQLNASYTYEYIKPDGTTVNGVTLQTSTLTLTGLNSASEYNLTITPIVINGSTTSTGPSFSLLAETLPSVPILSPSATTITNNSISFSWTGDPNTYYYSYTYTPGGTMSYKTTLTNATITGLSSGTQYTINITPFNTTGSFGSSGYCAYTTTLAPVIVNAPTSITSTGFTVGWSAPTGTTGTITYKYTYSSGSSNTQETTTANSITLSTLSSGILYTFSVIARSSGAESAQSNIVSTTTIPAAITSMAANNVSSSGFTLQWPNNTGAISYEYNLVYGSTTIVTTGLTPSSSTTTPTTVSTTQTSAVFTGLTAATSYTIKVFPIGVSGRGAVAQLAVNTLPNVLLASSVTSQSITTTSFVLKLTVLTGCNYSIKLNGIISTPSNTSTSTNETLITFTGLTSGTSYTVGITPKFGTAATGGEQVGTETVLPTPTITLPLAVANLRQLSVTGGNTYTFTWDESVGATSYKCSSTGIAETSVTSKDPTLNKWTVVYTIAAGGTATIQVKPVNSSGDGAVSSCAALTVASSPTSPVVTLITNRTCTVTWGATTGATSYSYTYTDGSTLSTSTLTAATVNLTGLLPGTAYTFSVSSVNATGTSASATTTFTTTPSAQGLIAATTLSSTQISLSWSAVAGATSYEYKYTLSTQIVNTTATVPTPEIPLLISSLVPGGSYVFTVTPLLGTGTTAIRGTSRDSSATITYPGTLTFPANKTELITTTSFKVNWNTCPGATSYTYAINPSPTVALSSTTTTATTYTFTNLVGGTLYTATITPTNNTGAGSGTPGTVSETTLPPAITGITPTSITSTSITLSWALNSSIASYAYTINGSPVTAANVTATPTVTNMIATFTNLTEGTNYTLGVIPVNSAGQRGASGSTTPAIITTLPGSISSITLQAGSLRTNAFTITWPAVQSATSYTYTLNPPISITPAQPATGSSTTLAFTSLGTGTSYVVTISPVNANGSGGSSSITVVTLPGPVANLIPSSITTSSFNVSWSPGVGVVGYLYYSTDPTTVTSSIRLETTRSTLINYSELNPGAKYTVTIIPLNSNNNPGQPSTIIVETLPSQIYSLTSVDTSITRTGFTVSWSPLDTSATTYLCNILPSGTCPPTYFSPSSTFLTPSSSMTRPTFRKNFTGLQAGQQYTVSITPVNSTNGLGVASTTVVSTMPDPPVLSSSLITSSGFIITWALVANISIYGYTVIASDGSTSPAQNTTNVPFIQMTNLNPGVTYTVSVITYNSNNVAGAASNISVTTLPPKISSITSSNISASGFSLSWPNDPGAIKYIYTLTSGTINLTSAGLLSTPSGTGTLPPSTTLTNTTITTTNTTAVFTNLTANSTYTISVTPVGVSGNALSTYLIVTTLPDQISALSVKPNSLTSSGFTLEWPPDPSATNFKFTYIVNSGASLNSPSNSPSATPRTILPGAATETNASFTGLNPNTRYTISVIPVGSSGQSGAPTLINVTTLPSAISTISVANRSLTNSGFTLSWPVDPNVTSYIYSINGSPSSSLSVSNLSPSSSSLNNSVFSSLNPGSNYNIGVNPVTSVGIGLPTYINVTTLPADITNLIVTPGLTTISTFTIQWDTNPTANNYTFTLNGVSSSAAVSPGATTVTAIFSNLNPATIYNVAVTPINSGGPGNPATVSVTTNFIPPAPTLPSTPQGIFTSIIMQTLGQLSTTSPNATVRTILALLKNILAETDQSYLIPLTTSTIKSILYTYYSVTNPTINTNLPIILISTTINPVDNNQLLNVTTLSGLPETGANIILPIDVGETLDIYISDCNTMKITRGKLIDSSNANQTNQIKINNQNWINYGSSFNVFNQTFFFVNATSMVMCLVTPIPNFNPSMSVCPPPPPLPPPSVTRVFYTPTVAPVTPSESESSNTVVIGAVAGVALIGLYFYFSRPAVPLAAPVSITTSSPVTPISPVSSPVAKPAAPASKPAAPTSAKKKGGLFDFGE